MDFLHQHYSNPGELGCRPAPEPAETYNNANYDTRVCSTWGNQGINVSGTMGVGGGGMHSGRGQQRRLRGETTVPKIQTIFTNKSLIIDAADFG
jgi:hypothetical protein